MIPASEATSMQKNAEFSHIDYVAVLHWERISRERLHCQKVNLWVMFITILFFSWGMFLASVVLEDSFYLLASPQALPASSPNLLNLDNWFESTICTHQRRLNDCLFRWFFQLRLGALEHATVNKFTLLLSRPILSCFHSNFLSNSI